jgi:hypothetical protein
VTTYYLQHATCHLTTNILTARNPAILPQADKAQALGVEAQALVRAMLKKKHGS